MQKIEKSTLVFQPKSVLAKFCLTGAYIIIIIMCRANKRTFHVLQRRQRRDDPILLQQPQPRHSASSRYTSVCMLLITTVYSHYRRPSCPSVSDQHNTSDAIVKIENSLCKLPPPLKIRRLFFKFFFSQSFFFLNPISQSTKI